MAKLNTETLLLLKQTLNKLISEPHSHPVGFSQVECGTWKCLFGWFVEMHGHRVPVFTSGNDATDHFHAIVEGHIECPFGLSELQREKMFGPTALAVHEVSKIGSPTHPEFNKRMVMSELHARRRYLDDLLARSLGEREQAFFDSIRPERVSLVH